jgi:cytochrome b561
MTIALHWATAAVVLFQFLTAQIWDFFPKPERHLIIVSHTSFGLILAAVLVVRIVWRASAGRRIDGHGAGWAGVAAMAAHRLLYVLLVTEVVLGFVLRWSGHNPLSFFGVLIASPFAPFSHAAHEIVDDVHDFIGWSIIVLAAGHAAAALLHHYVLGDGILRRMLPGLAARKGDTRRH